jgi:hypothetical protein
MRRSRTYLGIYIYAHSLCAYPGTIYAYLRTCRPCTSYNFTSSKVAHGPNGWKVEAHQNTRSTRPHVQRQRVINLGICQHAARAA